MSHEFFRDRVVLRCPSGETEDCEVSGEDDGSSEIVLRVSSPSLGSRSYPAADLFLALLEFRKQIEPAGWRVLVNGARQNAWPSGMSAQMSGGTKLYLLPQGRKPAMRDVADTFAPAPLEEIVTVDEQTRFHLNYFNRLAIQP